MTLDQYEVAVADAIAEALGALPDAEYAARIQVGRTVLREGDYDLDTAHGEMLTPAQAAAEALDQFGAAKRAQKGAA